MGRQSDPWELNMPMRGGASVGSSDFNVDGQVAGRQRLRLLDDRISSPFSCCPIRLLSLFSDSQSHVWPLFFCRLRPAAHNRCNCSTLRRRLSCSFVHFVEKLTKIPPILSRALHYMVDTLLCPLARD